MAGSVERHPLRKERAFGFEEPYFCLQRIAFPDQLQLSLFEQPIRRDQPEQSFEDRAHHRTIFQSNGVAPISTRRPRSASQKRAFRAETPNRARAGLGEPRKSDRGSMVTSKGKRIATMGV